MTLVSRKGFLIEFSEGPPGSIEGKISHQEMSTVDKTHQVRRRARKCPHSGPGFTTSAHPMTGDVRVYSSLIVGQTLADVEQRMGDWLDDDSFIQEFESAPTREFQPA